MWRALKIVRTELRWDRLLRQKDGLAPAESQVRLRLSIRCYSFWVIRSLYFLLGVRYRKCISSATEEPSLGENLLMVNPIIRREVMYSMPHFSIVNKPTLRRTAARGLLKFGLAASA